MKCHGDMVGLDAKAWADEEGVANVFSFADLADQHYVMCNNAKEDAFSVQSWKEDYDKVNLKFPRDEASWLHSHRFSTDCTNGDKPLMRDEHKSEEIKDVKQDGVTNKGVQPLDTAAENGKSFTTQEFERAKQARTLHHNVGAPGIEKFKGMLRTN